MFWCPPFLRSTTGCRALIILGPPRLVRFSHYTCMLRSRAVAGRTVQVSHVIVGQAIDAVSQTGRRGFAILAAKQRRAGLLAPFQTVKMRLADKGTNSLQGHPWSR